MGRSREEFESNVPKELKELKQWVGFILKDKKDKPGKKDKIPVNPVTKDKAKSNDQNTWTDFKTAIEGAIKNKLDGIGFMFKPPYVGIDIDGCIKDNTLSDFAKSVANELNSYTEVSPSGTGIHVICRGELPPEGRKSSELGLEMYTEGRFFTFTANRVDEYPAEVLDRKEEIYSVHKKYIAKKPAPSQLKKPIKTTDLQENDIIEKALNSKNGDKFRDLLNGNWESSFSSQSEADLSFCNTLAFWTGADYSKIDSIVRSSGLYRDKWDTKHFADGKTYGQNIIEQAIKDCREVYEPKEEKKERPISDILEGPSKRANMLFEQSYNRNGILGYKLSEKFKNIMYKLDGIQPGMYLLGAISNVGKTSLLLNLTKDLVEQNKEVQILFFSIDDNFRKIYFRLLAMEAKKEINYVSNIGQNIRFRKDLSEKEKKERLKEIDQAKGRVDKLLERFTLLDEVDGNSLDFIHNTIEQAYKINPKLIVVVDNFHKIRVPSKSGVDAKSKFTYLSEGMKEITNTFDIPVLMTVELRKLNGTAKPSPDDLKDTVDLHYDSDVVFMLHSEYERNKDTNKYVVIDGVTCPVIDLIVAKNKQSGFKGEIELVITPHLALYQEKKYFDLDITNQLRPVKNKSPFKGR